MMNKKIVLAGGTGFIGNYLAKKYRSEGYEVLIISRRLNHIHWDNSLKIIESLDDASMLINLAGKSVDCRYNRKNREEILSSRIDTTKILGSALLQCQRPPALWINSSTATIYRHAEDRPMTESTGDIGTGFSVGIATSWEGAFFDYNLPHTRKVALRMAIVLGKGGGVMVPLNRMAKLGFGGKQGNGRQMFSWLHIHELYRLIEFIKQHPELSGPINACAPSPVPNQEFMKLLRESLKISVALPAPVWLLKLGAHIIKTETELILKSRWVLPEKFLAAGYSFTYPTLQSAFKEINDKAG